MPMGDAKLLWRGTSDGAYTTASAYSLLNDGDTLNSRIWKLIWKATTPEKVRFFLWLAGRDALPTNMKRYSSHIATSVACIRCGAPVEDVEHVLRRCPGSAW